MAVLRITPRNSGGRVDSGLWSSLHEELGGLARDTRDGGLLIVLDAGVEEALDQVTALLHLQGTSACYRVGPVRSG